MNPGSRRPTRLANLHNRRSRLLDAFEMGTLETRELRKRVQAIQDEEAGLRAILDPDLLSWLFTTFDLDQLFQG